MPLRRDVRMAGLGSLFTFQGRIGRGAFWLAGLHQAVGLLVLTVASVMITDVKAPGTQAIDVAGLVLWAVGGPVLAWMGLAATVRRWHDRDKSGMWNLVGGVPLIGPIWVAVELCGLPGTPTANRFGPPPGEGVSRVRGDEPAVDEAELEHIVARWTASASTPAPAATTRVAARPVERPPVIVRPEGLGFGRRGLR